MFRLKLFVDFEKEEKWLEQKAINGYHLKSIIFGYHFEKKAPEKSTIKIDYRKFKKKDDFIDYQLLFEDSGWMHLAGSKNSGVQYFKKIDAVNDDIFSDTHSKAARYKRYADMSLELAISFLPLVVIFYLMDIMDLGAFLNPKALYLTPGLWGKTGSAFWTSFLFETPFALMRGFIWAFLPVMIVANLIFAYQSNKLYWKRNK